MASKQELLDFLDKHVFLRILHASEHNLGTQDEMGRFHGYDSAEKVVQMYKDDLHSTHAVPVNARLQDHNLPRLVDVKDEFLKLAGEAS